MTPRPLPCLFLTATLLLVASAPAQYTPPATATQAPVQAPTQVPPQTPAPVPTLRANSRLVVVDVVVSDKANKPVHDLKQTDFTLLEKGQPQTIGHFEEHTSNTGAPAKLPPAPKFEPGVFTNYSPAPGDGALNVLLLDSLNTPLENQAYVRDQILKYLKGSRPGTRMAIFGLNQRLYLLQGFTSDPDLLRNILEGKKGLAKASPLMDNAVSGDTVGTEMLSEQMDDIMGNTPGGAALVASMQQFEAQQAAFQLTLRVGYTLDALNLLGRYLSGLPGRKNLIWFSGSFPLNILPDGDLQDPFANVASFEDEFRETTNLLARSQIAVYPVDARGLMVAPMMSAADSGKKYVKNPAAYAKDSTKFFTQTADEHSTMRTMAEDTGGKAFVNTNGLKEAVDEAVEAGSNYYTLTYTPANRDWKGDFRKIQVKLAEQGYTLSYRRGYYATDPDAPSNKGTAETGAAAIPFDPMRAAMMRGGPDPTQVIFTAAVLPATGETDTTLVPGTKATPKAEGPYKRYVVGFTVSPRGTAVYGTPSGAHNLKIEFLTFVYNADGELITTADNAVGGNLNEARYKDMLENGLQVRQDISVPIKGEYFLRLGVHDRINDHVGALELPVSAVAKMKTLAAVLAEQQATPSAMPPKP